MVAAHARCIRMSLVGTTLLREVHTLLRAPRLATFPPSVRGTRARHLLETRRASRRSQMRETMGKRSGPKPIASATTAFCCIVGVVLIILAVTLSVRGDRRLTFVVLALRRIFSRGSFLADLFRAGSAADTTRATRDTPRAIALCAGHGNDNAQGGAR